VVTVTAPAVVVTVSPKTATVTTGLTQQFSASVTNTSNTAVTWQVNSVTGGNATTGTISATGLYTAPATAPAGAVTVKAISAADNTKSDTATVTVALLVSVTMSPKTASVQAGFTKQFTAAVANTSNTAVTWQVNNVTGGNSTVGTLVRRVSTPRPRRACIEPSDGESYFGRGQHKIRHGDGHDHCGRNGHREPEDSDGSDVNDEAIYGDCDGCVEYIRDLAGK